MSFPSYVNRTIDFMARFKASNGTHEFTSADAFALMVLECEARRIRGYPPYEHFARILSSYRSKIGIISARSQRNKYKLRVWKWR